ncbi:hypothetical protein BH09MYX1_BH09MYX1_35510 [soil metagenome]
MSPRFAVAFAALGLFVGPGIARADGNVTCPSPTSAASAPAPPPRAVPPPALASRTALPTMPPQVCFAPPPPDRTCLGVHKLCDADIVVAQRAWKYFENNYQPATGLVNAADKYPSTTMWDVGSSLFGTIAARELGIIDQKTFDDRITALLATLNTMKLFKDEAPNKAYNTATAAMSDYNNAATLGIGYSALDLARVSSALNALGCLHPKYAPGAAHVLARWKYCGMLSGGEMHGLYVDPTTKKESSVQEGRLGYEQYGGKVFAMLGFDQHVSASYTNPSASSTMILGVPVPTDSRDPRKYGANNYVVTESYALDTFENGLDAINGPLVKSIYEVQKRRFQQTGIVTAVSEDNVDRAPYFVYNTIFAAGTAWNTLTDRGADQAALRSISTKAAFALFTINPIDAYSAKLADAIASAYDPARGYYSGVYESGIGYNKAITANTNGIILEGLLYKAIGPINAVCTKCNRGLKLPVPACVAPAATCTTCSKGG